MQIGLQKSRVFHFTQYWLVPGTELI